MTDDPREIAARNVIRRAGRKAFHEGRAYADNPYPEHQPAYRLAWSTGHNEARAAKALLDEGSVE